MAGKLRWELELLQSMDGDETRCPIPEQRTMVTIIMLESLVDVNVWHKMLV